MDAIFVNVDDDVGVGTDSPGTMGGLQSSLHVTTTDGARAGLLVENAAATVTGRPMLELRNNGATRLDQADSSIERKPDADPSSHGERTFYTLKGFGHRVARSSLALLLVILAGCQYHASGSITLRFPAIAVTERGKPLKNARVWLRDARLSPSDQPEPLREPLCITNAQGTCSASVSYRFEYSTWRWPGLQRARSRNRSSLLVGVEAGDTHLVWGSLPRLSSAQIAGQEEVVCDLALAPRNSSPASREELVVNCGDPAASHGHPVAASSTTSAIQARYVQDVSDQLKSPPCDHVKFPPLLKRRRTAMSEAEKLSVALEGRRRTA